MRWQDDPIIVAKVIQSKYGFKQSYAEIQEMIEEEYGIHTSKKRIRDIISEWGLIRRHRNYYRDIEPTKVYDYFHELFNTNSLKIVPPKKTKGHIQRKILASDPHLPFVDEDLFKKLLNEKADKLIINGDIWDMYCMSRFIKYNMDITLSQEIHDSLQYIRILCETFPEVEFSLGNHFQRLFKAIIKHEMGMELIKAGLIKYKPEHILEDTFPNLKIASTPVKGLNFDYDVAWFGIDGDLAYGHFEKASKIVGKPVIDAYESMFKWRKAFDFNIDQIRVFAQSHTHKFFQSFYGLNDVMLLETGCLCAIQDYAVQPAMKYQPLNQGYLTFTQEDGVTDWDSMTFHAHMT